MSSKKLHYRFFYNLFYSFSSNMYRQKHHVDVSLTPNCLDEVSEKPRPLGRGAVMS